MSRRVTADTRAEAVVDALGLLYHNDLDPDEFMLFPETEGAGVRLETSSDVRAWQETYGDQDGFTCLIRTVLSQNTSDAASQPAYESLLERYGTGTELADRLATADLDELAGTIKSAGLYNQKARSISKLADRVREDYGGADGFDEFVETAGTEAVRDALLNMTGVGPKTADCVLLFAGGRAGVFPVDTHVHRIYRRLGIAPPDADHEAVRAVLEREVPPAKCGFGHTASIQFGRDYCTARRPACLEGESGCPLEALCEQRGVDPAAGIVEDPRSTGD